MYNTRTLFTTLLNHKKEGLGSFRSFRAVQVLNQLLPPDSFRENVDGSLFFTNLPAKKRERKVKVKVGHIPAGSLIIKCKHGSLNHYSGQHYGKFDTVPLASKGWYHKKSKGDHFTILPSKPHPAFFTKEDLPDTFEENGVNEKVIEQLRKMNLMNPTVIQAKCIRSILRGENVFITSECGSGKTLAYLIATANNVYNIKDAVDNGQGSSKQYNSPFAIILLPTRELALQIGQLANNLCKDLGIMCQTLIGGDINSLLQNPQKTDVDILICTPKVFQKHLERGIYSTNLCRHMVIDEADTLLEEDFFNEVKYLIKLTKLKFSGLNYPITDKNCAQMCLVSATAPKQMEERVHELMRGSDIETVSTPNLHKTIAHIPQLFLRVGKNDRATELLKIAKNMVKHKIPTLIFCNKVVTCNWVSHFLRENGVNCPIVNYTAYTENRLRNFREFQQGLVHLMSCTDLASRGLHFERVKRVVNFEFPSYMADYIHRCGRVGRLGQGDDCLITNFISSKHEIPLLNKIEIAVRTNSSLPNIYNDRKKIQVPLKEKKKR